MIMRKYKLLALLFSLVNVILFFIADMFFSFWVGTAVILPKDLSLILTVYVILTLFVASYNNFFSGIGKLKVVMILGIIKIIIYLPIAYFFISKYELLGLVVSMIIVSVIPNYILGYLQYKKIINNRARGIWNQ
jgi:Na+-driven multidrug efflux pump